MIVVDTSALIAVLAQEAAKPTLISKIAAASVRIISPITRVETVMVASRLFRDPVQEVDAVLGAMKLELAPIDETQTTWAVRAFILYGKGRHPAGLNLADCFSYAAAKALDAPLLYVGDDFAKTDIRSA